VKFFVTFLLTSSSEPLSQPFNLRDSHTIHRYCDVYQDTKDFKMRNKLLLVLLIIILGAMTSYLLSGNLLIYALTLLVGGTLLYFTKLNNKGRKENLNIIRDENKLYFYLSDDLLFSVDLLRNKTFSETLRESIKNEMSTINNITRKICFINFKDDKLLNELNSSLNIHQK